MVREKQRIENYVIDYLLLAKAKSYYDIRGFAYLEVPWIVNKKYSLITADKNQAFSTPVAQHLLGSGEQAFLQLAFADKVSPNFRFQTITPCFRRDTPDETHVQQFIKLELFEYFMNPVDPRLGIDLEFQYFKNQALNFYSSLTDSTKVREVPTKDGIDIELTDIEVGSYGIRSHKNVTWIYGTGLALPRFSYALDSSVLTIA